MKAVLCGCLVDGTGRPALDDVTILIEGNKITAVGERKNIMIPHDAEIIDATGKTVLHGLIDSHTHFLEWILLTHLQLIDTKSIGEIVGLDTTSTQGTRQGNIQGRQWTTRTEGEKIPDQAHLDGCHQITLRATRICAHMIT
jgi:predicted amidohydrolase YtcJ